MFEKFENFYKTSFKQIVKRLKRFSDKKSLTENSYSEKEFQAKKSFSEKGFSDKLGF